MGQRRRNGQNKLKVKRHYDVLKANKKFTRKKAEKLLANGADPAEMVEREGKMVGRFTDHPNPHVRRRAWQLMGRPLPEGLDEQNKFLLTLQGTEPPKDASATAGFYLLLRQRLLKEVPVKPEVQVETVSE